MTSIESRAMPRRSEREPTRILIVEPHTSGHHATYLRWVVEAVTENRWTAVVATTAEALQHPLLAGLNRANGHVELRIVDFPSPLGALASGLESVRGDLVHWWAIRRVVRTEVARSGIDAVVLPYLDYCFFTCGVLGVPYPGVPWHVISMRLSAGGATDRRVPWKWRLARRLLSAPFLKTLFSISPSVRHVPPGWLTSSMAAKLQYLPDPAEHRGTLNRDAARDQLGLAPGRLAVLVFGSLDERKGVSRLGEALSADPALEPYVLVVAGKQSANLRQTLAGAPFTVLRREQRVIEIDHVLDDAEQALVFAAADVVWLGYERHAYMSGVLVLAGHAALPVVATDDGEVGAFVREHESGVLVEAEGVVSVCAALRGLMEESARRTRGRRALTAVENHTPANLKRGLVAAIRSND